MDYYKERAMFMNKHVEEERINLVRVYLYYVREEKKFVLRELHDTKIVDMTPIKKIMSIAREILSELTFGQQQTIAERNVDIIGFTYNKEKGLAAHTYSVELTRKLVPKLTPIAKVLLDEYNSVIDPLNPSIQIYQYPLDGSESIGKHIDMLIKKQKEGWYDESIPALDGMSPRECAKTAEGRKKLERLFIYIKENKMEGFLTIEEIKKTLEL
jgi:hypothetical protein